MTMTGLFQVVVWFSSSVWLGEGVRPCMDDVGFGGGEGEGAALVVSVVVSDDEVVGADGGVFPAVPGP